MAPTSKKSPSTARKNGGNAASKSESKSLWEEHKNIIMGVAAGVGLLLAIIVLCICRCASQKKKKRRQQDIYEAQGDGDPCYYNNPHNPRQWGNGGCGEQNKSSPLPPPPKGNGRGSSSPMPPPPNGRGGGNVWGSSSPMKPPNGSESGWGSSPGMLSTSGGGPTYNGEESQNFSGLYPQALPPPPPPLGIPIGLNKNNFTYEELSTATGGFSRANMIGQGGFGYVHKGVLSNGKEVAIKSLKSGSGQGEREFQAEIYIVSRVHHRHLVSLVGYCVAGAQRMMVYDFVPNETLEYHLHGKNVPVIDFSSRLRIALGAAKGLAYLHEDCHPKIIHRDIKASNILLDNNFEAMVADFGFARLSGHDRSHVSTRVLGTYGYLAPEYASSGKLTDKSDVFSYGIVILELITGKQPVDSTLDEYSLVDWARPVLTRVLKQGNIEEIVDPRLEGKYDRNKMIRMVACASACVRHTARERPKMSQIVRALQGDASLEDLPTNNSIQPSGASSDRLNAL